MLRQSGSGRRACSRGSVADFRWWRSLDDHRGSSPTAVDRPRLAAGLRRWFQDHQTGPLRFPTAPVRSTRRWAHACSAGTCDRPRPGDHEEPAGSGEKRNCPNCGSPVGRSRDGQPGRTEGFCPKCGTRSRSRPSCSRAISWRTSTRWPAAWRTAAWAGSTSRRTTMCRIAGWC